MTLLAAFGEASKPCGNCDVCAGEVKLFNGKIGWVPWQRPGFDLGLQLRQCLRENPGIIGIMLGSHGLFTWGDTAYESYINTLEVIEACAQFLEDNEGKKRPVFGGPAMNELPDAQRKAQASLLAPILRGFCSDKVNMVGHFTDDARVLQFIDSKDLARLAPMGTSCPDHFLRTKISPLVLDIAPDADLSDVEGIKARLQPQYEAYRKMYAEYYDSCKHPNSPAMRDANSSERSPANTRCE